MKDELLSEKAQAHYDLHTAMMAIISDVSNLMNDVWLHNIEYEKKHPGVMDIDSWLIQEPKAFYKNAIEVIEMADKLNERD